MYDYISVSHVGLCMYSPVLVHACAHCSVRSGVSVGVIGGIMYVHMWLCMHAHACVYACTHANASAQV